MLFIKQGNRRRGFVYTYALPTELPAKTGEDSNLRPNAILYEELHIYGTC